MQNNENSPPSAAPYCQCLVLATMGAAPSEPPGSPEGDPAGSRARATECRAQEAEGSFGPGAEPPRCCSCRLPAVEGDLATLKWLWEQGCPMPYWRDVVRLAAQNGHKAVVSWAYAQGHPTGRLAILAASRGDLQILQCLEAAECLWDPKTCQKVARWNGHEGVADWIERSASRAKEPGKA